MLYLSGDRQPFYPHNVVSVVRNVLCNEENNSKGENKSLFNTHVNIYIGMYKYEYIHMYMYISDLHKYWPRKLHNKLSIYQNKLSAKASPISTLP